MINKRIATIAIAALSVGIASNAAVLDPAQAWSRACSTPQLHKIVGASAAQPQLLQTFFADEQPACYIFQANNSEGYVVVAADDAVAPLLGYSDNAYDADNMPDGLRYWIDELGRQIEWARANGIEYSAWQAQSKSAIQPMTKTKWNQGAPYNDLCPTYKGKECVTGCIATGAAQAMKYYNWPDKGEGSVSYKSSAIGQDLSMDFSQVEFDWDNMLDVYGSSATDQEKEAVAKLMQAVGYAVEMNYAPSESGAEVTMLAQALAFNFKYDKSLVLQNRMLYGINDWNDYIYDQLVNYGPVIYTGQSNQGGHCFVCDGYSKDGYFHFNWGWGGMSDGYFLLTALSPESQGIGGSASAYNFDQEIISNLCKAGEGSGEAVRQITTENFEMPETITIGKNFTLNNIPLTNYSIVAVDGNLGFKLVSSNGTVTYADGSILDGFKPFYTANSWQSRFSGLSDGTYTVTPAWYDDAAKAWQPVRVSISAPQSYTMTVSGTTATLEPNSSIELSVSNFQITALYTNAKFGITAKLKNTGADEIYQTAIPVFMQGEDAMMMGDMILLDILPGETMDMDYLSDLAATKNGSVAPGTYQFYLLNSDGLVLYEYGEVEVQDGSSTAVSFGPLSFPDGNDSAVDANDVHMQAAIECTAGYFANTVSALIFPNTTGTVYSIGSVDSQAVFLNAGESDTLDFTGAFDGEVGESYFAVIYYNNDAVRSTMVTFTLGISGITDVRVVDDQPAIYFNLNGVQMDSNSLAPGIYLKREGNRVSKTIVK